MIKSRTMFMFFIILLFLSLFFSFDKINKLIAQNQAKNTIESAFYFKNNKDVESLKNVYSDRYSYSFFKLENINKIDLIEIKLLKNEKNYNIYYNYGRGRINNVDRKNLIIFKVKYNIEYKDQKIEPVDSGIYEVAYFLIKENNTGNWKIDDVGQDYYE
ncbi:DUF4829 domain-containing protein [Desulfitobacterium hafniense]|uniref:DUF4829 domain-containing protein n=3 Tax=root TaxID=1 RepID=Q24UH7_DESHY|nr:DUF4829 domain-containing protein [Desulfitobacterium hafniense]KTE90747.1 hypothetical protein AT727_23780 [Desulfitobacterium hafniense]MEA5024728.1 DUF4829 domain-containing protein [Desulfitobacterium hafniense]BAE84315.1 hypothetical protein DSY2526 [Desulfitobacterium hafniense Y51]CDX02621.1 Hypothetical protein DPCES_2734 [Desulfitobacterium hafniense]